MVKASVIIPAYNSGKTIRGAIVSCLNQTLSDIEVIVVDNGSTDNTGTIVSQFNDPRIVYIWLGFPNRSAARNAGISKARGNYLQFLDADDTLEPDKISHDIGVLEKSPETFAIADAYYFNSARNSEIRQINPKTDRLLGHNIFHIATVLMRNDVRSYFDENISYCEDWLFWVQNFQGKKIVVDNKFVGCSQNVTGYNTMKNQKKMLEYQMLVLLRVRKIIRVRSLWMIKNDITLMLAFIMYCSETKSFEKVSRQNRLLYLTSAFVLHVPKIRKRVRTVVEGNDFV